MSDPSVDLLNRAIEYGNARNLELKHELGRGKDGAVYSTNRASAVKVFHRYDGFDRELACYLRLGEQNAHEILGHHVPLLVDADSVLLVIEMTIVERPFLLDFAGARLDIPPDFPPDVMEDWEAQKGEEFGTHWSHVKILLGILEKQFGIFLLDVHPGNVAFEDGK